MLEAVQTESRFTCALTYILWLLLLATDHLGSLWCLPCLGSII